MSRTSPAIATSLAVATVTAAVLLVAAPAAAGAAHPVSVPTPDRPVATACGVPLPLSVDPGTRSADRRFVVAPHQVLTVTDVDGGQRLTALVTRSTLIRGGVDGPAPWGDRSGVLGREVNRLAVRVLGPGVGDDGATAERTDVRGGGAPRLRATH